MPPDFDADTLAAIADDLTDRCVALHLAGITGPVGMARALAREAMGPTAEATPFLREAVQACLNGATWRRKLIEAKENLQAWVQKAALQATPIALHSVIFLASEANDDKRSRNSAAQFLLGAGAGLTPTQRHEVTAYEEFMQLYRDLYPKPVPQAVLPEDSPPPPPDRFGRFTITEFMLDRPTPGAEAPDRMEGME